MSSYQEAARHGIPGCRCMTCGKFVYKSRAARRGRQRIPRDRSLPPLSAYPCPVGTGWHLGHLPRIENARDVIRERRSVSDEPRAG